MTVVLSEDWRPDDEAKCRGHWSDQAWLAKLCEGCLRLTGSEYKAWYVEPRITIKHGQAWCEVRLDKGRRCEP